MIRITRDHYCACAAVLAISALVIYFWAPALFNHSTVIHVETARFGLPMMAMQPNVFEAGNGILWSNYIAGGHPLFAEAQGAFANPLRYLLAESFEPILAYNAYHAFSTLIGGLGVYFLCRFLGLRVGAAFFSSIAATFSTAWMFSQGNHVTIGTLAWVPWFLLAAEFWFREHSVKSSICLAITTFLLIVSGYPQIAHGAALYFLFSLLPELFYKHQRQALFAKLGALFASGALAVLLALGLSAVQLLPLAELTTESHRAEGIELAMAAIPDYAIRGLLFSHFPPEQTADNILLGSVGSVMIVSLAMVALTVKKPIRILAHLWAGFLLFNLVLQDLSPIFRVVYENHLIPGLHFFRFMGYYSPVAVIGFCICAGYSVHCLSLSGAKNDPADENKLDGKRLVISLLLVSLGVVALALVYVLEEFSKLNFVFVVLLGLGVIVMASLGRLRHASLLAILLVVIESVLLRFSPFPFVPSSLFEEPVQARIIKSQPDYKMYKTMDMSLSFLHVLRPPNSPDLEATFERMLSSAATMHNLLWGIPSVDAALSLTLKRRAMIRDLLIEEASGNSSTPPGMRLMDSLSIKYLAFGKRTDNESLEIISKTRPGVLVYKNEFARKIVQLYDEAEANESAEEMLEKLKHQPSTALQVETEKLPRKQPAINANEPVLDLISISSRRYEATVNSGRSVWLFIADANYPGWSATVNGVKTRLYSAQMVGKAVHLPPGKSVVVVEYFPMPFYVGVGLFFLSFATILLISIRSLRRK